ncbi:MAG: NAD(P)-dependent oxidoreductase [Verrucomicrobia bacterium]|nr:NAD(P)-dependent oxidoreductase [Verrucomicrobiota bacterium]
MDVSTKYRVSFLGLGVMGYPMAGHLARRGGHQVTVFNRTAAKAAQWVAEYGGASAATPAEAVREADFVFMCVGNDEDVWNVAMGADGAVPAMKSGAILVDNTTASADVARRVHAAAKARGLGFLDAPVSGGQAGAVNGQLTVMVGGDPDDFARAQPVVASYAKAVTHMGPAGAGQLTKMVNQICIAGLVQGLSEGLAFAEKAGLDGNLVLQAICKGAAGSWQMENRGGTMLQRKFDFGFAVDWMRKDLGITMAEAQRNGAQLPVASLVDSFYAEVQKNGGGRWDTSSLITRL